MKPFAAIYGLFILLLSLVPCTDGFHQHEHDEQSAVVMEQGESHSAPHDDHCTPFCSCHCCHTHTILKQTATIDEPAFSFSPVATHDPYRGLLIPHNIFQPPKG